MQINDLVPGPLLEQMETTNGDQSNFVADAEVPTEYPRDSFATPEQPSGFAVPYSTHATVENSETPEAAAQAEARRNTEEFMRNFQAQREVEEVAGEAGQVQNLEQPAVSEGDVGSQPEGQSQEILKEIFLQRQILDNVHYTGPSPATPEQSDSPSYQSEGPAPASDPSHEGLGADSVSVETPVTSYQNYQQAGEPPAGQDDRDMLYVNETQRYTPPQAEQPPQPPPFPNVETSTGNAQRMDYNQLFDQLRNSSPEQ